MQTRKIACALMVAALAGTLGACSTPSGGTTAEKQSNTLTMRDQTLSRLEKEKPEAKTQLQSAAGYAVFQTIAMGAGVGGSNGYGVAENKSTQKQTFMRMSSNSLNLGVSATENRLILIFKDQATYDKFVAGSWQWGGNAQAGAKGDASGKMDNSAGNSNDNVTVYQLTNSGFALTANLGGARFWPDKDMNSMW